jgi:hypothetical protein
MSQQDVDVVRRFHEPWEGTDVMPRIREAVGVFGPDPDPAVVEAWWAEDPGWRHVQGDIEWDTRAVPGVGTKIKGAKEVAAWWGDWTNAWESYVYRNREYRDLGGWVLCETRIEARGPSNVAVEMTVFQLWKVRDDKIAACRVFMSEADALESARLG